MTDEEIKLCRELGEYINGEVYKFYNSKRNIHSLQIPNEEIRNLLQRYSEDYYRLARLHQLEKIVLDHTMLNIAR